MADRGPITASHLRVADTAHAPGGWQAVQEEGP